MVDGRRYSGCQMQGSSLCEECGLGMAGEMSALYNLNPSTVIAGLNLRRAKKILVIIFT